MTGDGLLLPAQVPISTKYVSNMSIYLQKLFVQLKTILQSSSMGQLIVTPDTVTFLSLKLPFKKMQMIISL